MRDEMKDQTRICERGQEEEEGKERGRGEEKAEKRDGMGRGLRKG